MVSLRKVKNVFWLSFAILVLTSSRVFGFSIEPMFLNMGPNGSDSRAVITVNNSSPYAMPVRASISSIVLDINGNVSSKPNSSDFIIFPPQAVIQPHGKQAFRVQWRGQPNLPQGKTYEISISQVLAEDNRPKDNEKKAALKLQLAMAFGSVVSMRSATGSAKPVVRSSHLSRNAKGVPILDTIIANDSNQNFLLIEADSTVSVFGANGQRLWSKTYSSDEMNRKLGLGVVQPRKSRRMQIPLNELPDNIARQAKSIKLEIRPSAK